MDLLLTHGYFLEEDAKEAAIMKPYAPLGLLYLSSHLRNRGFAVDVYDSTFGSLSGIVGILQDTPPSVLGIYGNLMTRANVLRLIRAAREAGWKVVLGGPEPASYPNEYLAAGAQVIVQGEGEVTMEELLTALRAEGVKALHRVDGTIFQDDRGGIVRTPPRALISDLDEQPWPDRERIDTNRYLAVWRERHGTGSVSLVTARGCPYRCRWCSHATYGNTHRRRSARGVADEVSWLVNRFAPDMLWIADDVFTIHHPWIMEYRQEMKRRGLRIPFECITRADRLNPHIADAIADLGCFRVWIGSESGSQRILDAMDRGVTVEQIRRGVALCRERGIETGMFLMWGYEGEEIEDIEATVRHVKETLPDVFLTTVSYPIKGTPYYQDVAGRLAAPSDWEHGTDRDLKIRGRHSRTYYRHADQLLKSEVALHRLALTGQSEDGAEPERLRMQVEDARRSLAETSAEVEA